ncbi:Fe-S protein [Microbacterium sp. Marseille-Q6965]|uniref:Fe-S protein n=1 Tax=Microbacterium sp. Marseille-Q6965 TaxID=2965072 RepID=UPI0021B7B58B|nr:Fe-S protein [Microbacterium sp. Marseille-Q6965]
MEILRNVVLLVHLTGFAILFGAWVVEAASRRYQATRLMDLGVLVAGVAGLALAAPWGLDHDLNYVKIGIKLVVLIVIGALVGISTSRARKGNPLPSAVFWLIGALTLLNAGLALIWR